MIATLYSRSVDLKEKHADASMSDEVEGRNAKRPRSEEVDKTDRASLYATIPGAPHDIDVEVRDDKGNVIEQRECVGACASICISIK